jgi:calcineurin-like phosphoesterase
LATLTRDIGDYSIERTLTVEVLNGTAVTGLAGRTAEMLRSFGYDVISIGNAEHTNYENTVIIHRAGDERTVRAFSDLIRCTNIHRELVPFDELEDIMLNQNIELRADVTLLLGRNFNGRYVSEN